MDFKEIMAEEIERKKRKLSSKAENASITQESKNEVQEEDENDTVLKSLPKDEAHIETETKQENLSLEEEEHPQTDQKPVHRLSNDSKPHAEDGVEKDKKARQEEDMNPMLLEQVDMVMFKEDPEKTQTLISKFFKNLLRDWEASVEKLPEAERKTSQGRQTINNFKQSKECLKPLFKQIKKSELPKDILVNVTKICMHMQRREYVNANDAYLRLAIGNAPWPIGVTMVGIHERSARERISSSQTAHVLNDEVTRKWLQAIKRLITFCQTKYPPANRSQLMG